MKKILSTIFAVVLSLSITVTCLASGVCYLPDVTSEMSSPSFWADAKYYLGWTYFESTEKA